MLCDLFTLLSTRSNIHNMIAFHGIEIHNSDRPVLNNSLPPRNVHSWLYKYDDNYWVQADLHFAEHFLVGPFDFTTRRVMSSPRQKSSLQGEPLHR